MSSNARQKEIEVQIQKIANDYVLTRNYTMGKLYAVEDIAKEATVKLVEECGDIGHHKVGMTCTYCGKVLFDVEEKTDE